MKTVKKIGCLLICIVLLIPLLAMPANAAASAAVNECVDVNSYQLSIEPYEVEGKTGKHFSLRIVARHERIATYQSFGYRFSITYEQGEDTVCKQGQTPMHNKVYRSVCANGETVLASEYDCEYLSLVSITDIPVSCGDLTVTVTPVVTYHGAQTETVGTAKVFTASLSRYFSEEQTLSVMTFNMYHHDTETDHIDRVKSVIKTYAPDVIGFQEITQTWIEDKLMADAEIAALYGRVGTDRGDSTHEQTAIFYRKDKFDLIESETRWLYGEDDGIGSDTVGGLISSKEELTSGDKVYYRCYTYAILERKSDSKRIAFANTHLELDKFTSAAYPNKGDVKNKQIDYVLNFAKSMQAQGYPVILTGDFNARMGSVVCNKILNAGFVRAEAATTKQTGEEVSNATQSALYKNGYKDGKKKVNYGIDHVFVLAENCYFDTYRICDEKIKASNGVEDYPSDHLPRIAVIAIS